MFSRLTALVSGTSLPFETQGEPHPAAFGAWQHFRGTLKVGMQAHTVWRVLGWERRTLPARLELHLHLLPACMEAAQLAVDCVLSCSSRWSPHCTSG